MNVLAAGPDDPAANLALEEALIRAVPLRPVLRIWQNADCVVIGRAQRVSREANLAACVAGGVPVLRRASGGGAVFHDLGNLNVTIAIPGWVPALVSELAGLLATAIGRLGLAARVGTRGVLIGDAKVSGLASQVTRHGTLAHATLLVTTRPERIKAFLAPAPRDPHPLDSHRCTALPLVAFDPALDVETGRRAVLAEAAARYGPLSPRPPSAAERGWQARLLTERYRHDRWHQAGSCSAQFPATKEASWTTKPVLSSTG
jgi:lipoate-protein ligase A